MKEEGHQEVSFFRDVASGFDGIVAIHDTTLGPSMGGVRMWPYQSEGDALRDVLKLSKAMTYKAAVANLDLGGGKAIIIGDPLIDKTEELLRAYGRVVDSLHGRYITAQDVGINGEDLDIVKRETNWVVGHRSSNVDSASLTAFGVFQAMRACVKEVYGVASLRGHTIAIQGFGKVASQLAPRLVEEGASLLVSETDPEAYRRAEEAGAIMVPHESIYDVNCDIFAPCALGGIINQRTIPRLRCRIVAGAANNQLMEPEDGSSLCRSGILYAPDYVANAGGLIGLASKWANEGGEIVRTRVANIYNSIEDVVTQSKTAGMPTSVIADSIAENRLGIARLTT